MAMMVEINRRHPSIMAMGVIHHHLMITAMAMVTKGRRAIIGAPIMIMAKAMTRSMTIITMAIIIMIKGRF